MNTKQLTTMLNAKEQRETTGGCYDPFSDCHCYGDWLIPYPTSGKPERDDLTGIYFPQGGFII